MRALPAFGLAAAAALASPPASADEPKAAPGYRELPLVTVPAVPEKAVGWVGAHERTPGFVVRHMDGGSGVQVFASDADEKAVREQPMPELAGCFREPNPSPMMQPSTRWGRGEPHIGLWDNGAGATHFVRSERLVESDDHTKATLETTDAWVDARTRGARLVARGSLGLVAVGDALGAVRVYAAREEAKDGKRVHVVIARKHVVAPSVAPFVVEHEAGQSQGSCGHEHVVLRADTADGDVAVVKTTVELPNHAPEGPTPPAEDLVELRLRELEVQLGASQASRDPQPVFTASFGWSAREQRARVPAMFMGMPRAKMRRR